DSAQPMTSGIDITQGRHARHAPECTGRSALLSCGSIGHFLPDSCPPAGAPARQAVLRARQLLTGEGRSHFLAVTLIRSQVQRKGMACPEDRAEGRRGPATGTE